MHHFLSAFEAIGAQEIFPAMMEYEETLSDQDSRTLFRAVDPTSHKTLSLRGDMTPQIARIAGTALKGSPRPLKLSYAGTNMRVSAGMLNPRRQFTQVGMEVFGSSKTDVAADECKTLSIALTVLKEVLPGKKITLDISLPELTRAFIANAPEASREAAEEAIRHKSISKAEAIYPNSNIATLITLGGDRKAALETLKSLTLPTAELEAAKQSSIAAAEELANILAEFEFDVAITIDPLDLRAAAHYDTVSYTLLIEGFSNEIGRGGRYTTNTGETATGLTLYLDDVIEKEGLTN